MSHVARRSVGLIALASVAAAAGVAVGALAAPLTRRRATGERAFGIHRVPARPALWDARPSTGPLVAIPAPRDVSPVPPESNHAPAGS